MQSPKLDDFQLLAPIGMGTVGTIYAAIDLRAQSSDVAAGTSIAAADRHSSETVPLQHPPLAIEILHPNISHDPLVRARFKREISLLSRMQHPNVIGFYGGGESDGTLFCVMERVDGGSVGDLLKHRGTLPWTAVVSVIRQTCSALQCAHNHGVVHRDLKPSNLFLTQDGQVKLGDFGIARDLQNPDISSTGMTVGTHAYMAPEQITGDRSLSGKADLYSLGCCAFEMLTGRPPFQGDNYVQLFEQHLRAAPPRVRNHVPDCPAALEEAIVQMLAKSAEDRPFNARTIQGLMLQIIQDHPDVFAPPTASAATDLTAADVGQAELAKLIHERLGMVERREISWGKLLAVAALIAIALGIASIAGR